MSKMRLESWEELVAAEAAESSGADPGGEEEMLPWEFGLDNFDDESYQELILGADERRSRPRWELDPASAEDHADSLRGSGAARRWR